MIASAKPKILLLDDDTAFLDVATYYLEQKFGNNVIVSKFNTSQNFLEHIHNHCYLPETSQDILHSFYSGDKSKADIEQALRDLSELPAILVIDHHLRKEITNGIELSQYVREFVSCPFIILLTAEVDTNKAINLHNNEIIDLFVRKDDTNPMDYVHTHLTKQIAKLLGECNINPEDAFGFETVLEDASYIARRNEVLNEISYRSYLTISDSGDIAILNMNDQINYYSYNNKVFSHNG